MTKSINLIQEELIELLKVVHTEENRLGRRLTTLEENNLLIPFIETHSEELFQHAMEHLETRRTTRSLAQPGARGAC